MNKVLENLKRVRKDRIVRLDTNDNSLVRSKLPQYTISIDSIVDGGYDTTFEKYLKKVTYTYYLPISYEALAKKLIAERYSIEDELKLHREERENPYNEEYLEYVRYVKECLATARQWIEYRNNVLGV